MVRPIVDKFRKGFGAPEGPPGVFSRTGHVGPAITQGSTRVGKTKSQSAKPTTKKTAFFKVTLDREVVCMLKQRAARESLAAERGSVSWQTLLRRAAVAAATEG